MRIVACVLILASAAMFLLPWMGHSLTVEGRTGTIDSLLEEQMPEGSASMDEMKDALCQQAEQSLKEALAGMGANFDAKDLFADLRTLLKGAWTPTDLLSILGGVKSTSGQLMEALEPQMEALGDVPEVQMIQQADQYLTIAYYILLVLVILTLASGLLAVICAITGHRGGMIPYLIFSLLLLAVFIVLVLTGNQKLPELFQQMGSEMDENNKLLLTVGLGGILCAALAVLAFVAMCIPVGGAAAKKSAAAAGWTCPICGTQLKADQKFCLYCGGRRPEEPLPERGPAARSQAAPAAAGGWTCPTCGAKLTESQKFCLQCGTKRPAAAPAPAPKAAPAAAGGWTCPTCGAKLTESQKFCLQCGTKRPAAAPAPAPKAAPAAAPAAAGGWTCPTCGAKLTESQKFCLQCGTKRPAAAPAPAPAPKAAPAPAPAAAGGWTCPTCGAKLTESQKFCLHARGCRRLDLPDLRGEADGESEVLPAVRHEAAR